jgi:hypothetical protein
MARADAIGEPRNQDASDKEEPVPAKSEEQGEENGAPSDELADLRKKESDGKRLSKKERQKLQEAREAQEDQESKQEGKREAERAAMEEEAMRHREELLAGKEVSEGKTASERESIIRAKLHIMTAEKAAKRTEQLLQKKQKDAEKAAKKSVAEKEEARIKKETMRRWKEDKKKMTKLQEQINNSGLVTSWELRKSRAYHKRVAPPRKKRKRGNSSDFSICGKKSAVVCELLLG